MILNLNAEQFLFVYNRILDNPTQPAQELKNKMDALLLDALSSVEETKNQTKFSSWVKQEQERVASLKSELKTIKDNIPDDGLYCRPVEQVE